MQEHNLGHPVRTPDEVFEGHLRAFAQGIDALVYDYTEASVIVLQDQTVRGLAGIRQFFTGFLNSIQPGFWESFKILRQEVNGDIAYLAWEANPQVRMAVDTLLIHNGKIRVQTFTVLA